MNNQSCLTEWKKYTEALIARAAPIVETLGYTIDQTQPHIGGERFLMQAITTASGKKVILLGTRSADRKRVVIKITDEKNGVREIQNERRARHAMQNIRFGYSVFSAPQELFFGTRRGLTFFIQEYIDQEQSFLERPKEEQYALILSAFKAEEGAHATTFGHHREAKKVFEEYTASTYLKRFREFQIVLRAHGASSEVQELLERAYESLYDQQYTVNQYSGFLTHTDFVPHNFRVRDNQIYLLDHSSIRFGNKHESWARCINFMELYHPVLRDALIKYVADNRTPEESKSLELMRLYRLGEIMAYYAKAAEAAEGDLKILNEKRILFWGEVLRAVLTHRSLDPRIREDYMQNRDQLRSEEEKKRQIGLH